MPVLNVGGTQALESMQSMPRLLLLLDQSIQELIQVLMSTRSIFYAKKSRVDHFQEVPIAQPDSSDQPI